MKKEIYIINISYYWDANHARAHYTFDGGLTYKNEGQADEIFYKSVKGFDPVNDPNGKWNEVSDVEETHTSVKSPNYTLVNEVLADNFEDTLTEYFARVASVQWAFCYKAGDELVIYEMNAREFETFIRTFHYWNEKTHLLRGKKLSITMIEWLDKRVTE